LGVGVAIGLDVGVGAGLDADVGAGAVVVDTVPVDAASVGVGTVVESEDDVGVDAGADPVIGEEPTVPS
jgi:hypothetical protein